MGQKALRPEKHTLDKDLEKLSAFETASRQVSIGMYKAATAVMFAGLAAIYSAGLPEMAIAVVAAFLTAYMAMNIAANDVIANIGAAVGARAMSTGFALAFAGFFGVAGACLAGRGVTDTIALGILRADGLAVGALVWAMLSALVAAPLLVTLARWFAAPVSTTQAIVGSVLGAGLIALGPASIDGKLVAVIMASWVILPLLGGGIAALCLYAIQKMIVDRADKIDAARHYVPVLVALMGAGFSACLIVLAFHRPIEQTGLAAVGVFVCVGLISWRLMVPVIERQARGLENRNQSLRRLFRVPLIVAAALMSFAHGSNDVAAALSPLAAIVRGLEAADGAIFTLPRWEVLILVLGLAAGILLHGPKLVRLVGAEITRLNPMRGCCVLLATALTVLGASVAGIPVSSMHIAVGAVFGIGFFREWYSNRSPTRHHYGKVRAGGGDKTGPLRDGMEVERRRLVRRSHLLTTLAGWVITLPVAGGLAGLVTMAMLALFA